MAAGDRRSPLCRDGRRGPSCGRAARRLPTPCSAWTAWRRPAPSSGGAAGRLPPSWGYRWSPCCV